MIYVSSGPRYLYLAYGSNLNVKQMNLRCPGALPVGRVTVPDRRLVFRGGSHGKYLTLDAAPGESVECIAWRIGEAHERALDRYEGYPGFYVKEQARLPLRSLDGKPAGIADCMWYVLPSDSFPLGAPSQVYTRTCVEGYQRFGLSLDALKKALYDSTDAAGVAITLGFPREEWD